MTLAACAPSTDNAGPEPQPRSSNTPFGSPAPKSADPVASAKVGDTVNEADAAKINESFRRGNDPKAYHLPSGEWVVVKGTEPLPPKVTEAVTNVITPLGAGIVQSSEVNVPAKNAYRAGIAAQEAATGKSIIVVLHGMSYIGNGDAPRWMVGVPSPERYEGESKEEAIAVAQKWVDSSPTTRVMLVVDALG
ncbi:hypothetical protein [Microbacterium capsulatum]|uniref:Lipoprotein n=1 Tax=Microbacterium capsulatum TaxID=3041921 RepID=A0ABU0XG09_9MICO|nr:hypothetical protein [Microbacterium sp. ASV81]MDQ4214064.1 hypothetical protein [Microbacterium sp. ASV81]